MICPLLRVSSGSSQFAKVPVYRNPDAKMFKKPPRMTLNSVDPAHTAVNSLIWAQFVFVYANIMSPVEKKSNVNFFAYMCILKAFCLLGVFKKIEFACKSKTTGSRKCILFLCKTDHAFCTKLMYT